MKVQLLSIVFSILVAVSAVNYAWAGDTSSVSNASIIETEKSQITRERPDASVLEDNNYHYLYKGKPVHLQRIKDRYIIKYNKSFASTAPRFKQKRYFRNASYRQSKISGSSFDIVTIDRKHVRNRTSADIVSEFQSEVAGDLSVQYAAPVYFEPQSGEELLITNRVVVRVANKDYSELQKSISSAIDVVFEREIMPQVLLFKCQNLQNSDAIERCAVIERMPGVVWAEPDMVLSTKNCFIPDDALYAKQWHHKNDGSSGSTAGADMRVTTAWDFQRMADTNITIAVFDQGIDLTHPDLRLVQGRNYFDTTTPPSPSNPNDNHGTAVAGIAAAIGNNGIGVAGVGAGARIMPIKILDDYGRTTTADKVDAITWAMNHGADIMNNSWISTGTTPAAALEDAIKYASINGRNGKGCLMFFGSGNDASAFKSQAISFSSNTPYYVSFVYKKDASGSGGSDNVCVDNIIVYGNNGDSVVYLETFAGPSLPSGWSTFGGTNGSSTIDNSKGWFRCDTVHQSGFSEDTISFCSGAISDNQWTELRMPLHTFHPGEQIKCNYRISSEDGHDSLLIKLFYDDGTEAAVYNIASGMRSSIPYVYYPAAMDSAIVVGASTDLDYRSDYSQYDVAGTGKTVDFLAPSGGGFFGTTTTDRTGKAGYDTTADYTTTFSGTSSACPAASGLAALILSKNPHLSRNKVLEVMRSTCDQIGGVTYTNGVHKEYGHGRLNALRALENLPPVITGQNPLAMTSNGTLTISTSDLIIFDAETPFGPFILDVYGGANYTVSNKTITTTLTSGTLRVPVSIRDGRYQSDICTLSVNVHSSNVPPSITTQHPITILEDHRYRILSSDLVITDSDNPSGPFLITAGAGVNYTLSHDSIIPQADFNGTLTVPVTASDGLASSTSFNVSITITPVNDAPRFDAGFNVSVSSDTGAYSHVWATSISPGPSDEASQTVTFTVTSTNVGLFDVIPSMLNNGTLNFTPNPIASGFSTVTVVCNDNGGIDYGGSNTSGPHQFTITIGNNNSPPSFTPGNNVAVNEDAGAQTISWATNIYRGSPNESGQQLHFNVSNNNSSLFTVQPGIDSLGVLSFTSAPDRFGSAQVTARLYDDGGGNDSSSAHTFTITINNVNDPPTFVSGGDQTVLEDAGMQTVPSWASVIGSGPYETNPLQFRVTTTNPALFLILPAINNTGTLSYRTAQNANGRADVRVRLFDGIDSGTIATFYIDITPVNDAPSFTKGSDISIEERSTPYSVPNWATLINMGPSDESTQHPTFHVSATNSTLFSALPDISQSGELSFTPAAGQTGTSTVTVTLSDDGLTVNGGIDTSPAQQFTITIRPINMPPSFTGGPDISVNEDTGSVSILTWATYIYPGAPGETGQVLDFTVSNNDTTLFSLQPQINRNGTLSFTTSPNRFGSARVITRLCDNGGGNDSSAADTFTITINAINDPPSFTVGDPQRINEDAPQQIVRAWAKAISPGPYEIDSVFFRCVADRADLFSIQPSVNDSGDLSYTPAPDANGTATVYLYLHDGTDSTGPVPFQIIINAVNDPPVFTAGPAIAILEDAPSQTFTSWATLLTGPANENGQAITSVSISADDTTMFLLKPSMTNSGDLSFHPAANRYGTVTITATITDNAGTSNGGVSSSTSSFQITILPVNDRPVFTKGEDISVNEDAGLQLYPRWATSISTGPYESAQTFSFSTTTSNPSLFSVLPAIDQSGRLSFSPATNAFGLAQVTVVLRDSGGTTNGGIDSSLNATFTINITQVNDPPQLTISGVYELTAGTQTVITVRAIDPDRDQLSIDITGSPSFSVVDYPDDQTATVTCYPTSSDTGTFYITAITEDAYLSIDSTIAIHVSAPLAGRIFITGVSAAAKTCINASSAWPGVNVLTGPGSITNLPDGVYSLSISENNYKTMYYYGTISAGHIDTITFTQHAATPLMFSSALPLQISSGQLNAGGLVSVVIDDIDNDRKKDVVYTGTDGKIYQCKGNGVTWSSPAQIYSGFTGRNTLRCIDWNNDGFNDLLLFNVNGTVWLCRGSENGQLQKDIVLFTLNTPGCSGMDIVQQANGSIAFYIGFSDGTIQYLTLDNDGTQHVSIVRDKNGQPVDVGNDADVSVFDVSGNGKMELLAGNSNGNVKIFTMKNVDTASGSFVFSMGGIPTGQNGRVTVSPCIGNDSTVSMIVVSDNNGAIYRSTTGVRGDVNDDGRVDVLDLQQLGIHWGKRSTEVGWTPSVNLSSSEPVTGTQIINVFDLQVLGNSWGLRK